MERTQNKKPFLPEKIIKVYQQAMISNYYLEIADVIHAKPKPDGNWPKPDEFHVGAFRPLGKNTIRRIAGAASDHKIEDLTRNAFLDPGLLRFSPFYHNRHILWYRPATQKELVFRKESLKVWMPAMLYFVVFDNLRIFALKSNSRPTLKTQLFIAPIMNLSGPYGICWGSVKVTHEIKEIDTEMQFWEDRLWTSTFAHVGHRCSKSEIMSLYRESAKYNSKFPKKELIRLDMTVLDILQKHLP